VESGEAKIAGVNAFTEQDEEPIELLQIDESAEQHQLAKLAALRKQRDQTRVDQALAALGEAAKGTDNTVPFILEAVRAYCTVGEICDTFRSVFGTYTETSVL
jgi:methylmalonyl-CoA mutase N-terminal domain/subunit